LWLIEVIFYIQEELNREDRLSVINDEDSMCFKLIKYSVTSFLQVLNQTHSNGYFSTTQESNVRIELLIFKILKIVIENKDNIVILRKDFLETIEVINSSLNSSLQSSIE
jgi:hypothetical protein